MAGPWLAFFYWYFNSCWWTVQVNRQLYNSPACSSKSPPLRPYDRADKKCDISINFIDCVMRSCFFS